MFKALICMTLLAGSMLMSQEASKPTEAPKPSLVSSTQVQNAILKAEHDLDVASRTKDQAELQFHQLQAIYQKADADSKVAERSVTVALEAAYTEKGFSKEAYDYDPANFTFAPKSKPLTNVPKK